MAEQYGQIVGGFETNPQELSGSVVPLGQINGGVNMAATMYEKNYELLDNKPQINSVELSGDKSSEELHIVACKTSAEWAELITLQSRVGEIYVYSDGGEDAEGNPIPAIKIGNGNAYVVDLPFATGVDMRITDEDIENWNNKVAVRIEGDRLIFY